MKLRDVIQEFISGDWGQENISKGTQHEVFCIRGADIVPISNNNFDGIPQRYISSKSKQARLLQKGDIVIEKSGGSPVQSTGRVVYISENLLHSKGDIVCSNFCCAIRIKESWNPKFVYYYWNHIYNSGVFFNYEGKTSGIKNLMLYVALSSIEIPDYPLKIQNEIVEILDQIENKIAINREINRNLEALARQLYDYWFVQFDFPDENGNPYKSSGGKMVWNEKLKREIPEGWRETTLGEFCEMYQPQTLATEDLNNNEKYWVYGANGIIGKYQEYNHASSEIAMACRGNSCGVVNRTLPESWITGNAMVIKPKSDIHNEFILRTIPYINIKGVISGSGQPQLTRENLSTVLMYRPSPEILKKYSMLAQPNVQLFLQNLREINDLTYMRDKLLPLLMNGQVSFKLTAIN